MSNAPIAQERPAAGNGSDGTPPENESRLDDAEFWRERHRQTRLRLARLWTAYQDLQRENAHLGRALAERVDHATSPRVLQTNVTFAQKALAQQETNHKPRALPKAKRVAKKSAKRPSRAKKTTKKTTKKPARKATKKPRATKRRSAPAPRTATKAARRVPKIKPHYPVGLYRIEKVPGIGARDLRRLRDQGINLTDALIYADIDALARDTKITHKRLDDWRAMSELMAIQGIGATWAETLVKADVRGIHDLARHTPEDLGKTLIEHYEKQRLGKKRLEVLRRTVPARAANLVKSAREAVQAL